MNRWSRAARAALPAVLCAAGCSGYINAGPPTNGGPDPVSGAPTPSGPGSAGVPDAPNVPGPAPLRRLTIREYNQTVRDLLGVPMAPRDFAIDQDAGGFAIGGPVSTSVDAVRLLEAADTLAAGAAARLTTLLPCPTVPADAAGQGSCAR